MHRLKPLLFVLGLSLVSAVTLRVMLGRVAASMQPEVVEAPLVDSAEVARRLVGCGRFHFVFDSLGYRTGQWPPEVDSTLSAARESAIVSIQDGAVFARSAGGPGPRVGEYLIQRDTAYLTLQGAGAGVRARLGPVGDSLAGQLERLAPAGAVIGRLFLTSAVGPAGCPGA